MKRYKLLIISALGIFLLLLLASTFTEPKLLEKREILKQLESMHSITVEGSLLSEQYTKGSSTEEYTMVQSQRLLEKTTQLYADLETKRVSQSQKKDFHQILDLNSQLFLHMNFLATGQYDPKTMGDTHRSFLEIEQQVDTLAKHYE